MDYKDYYHIMGLEQNATQEDVKRAYRKLARKYHPDVSKEAQAEERFKELGEAYEVLKDPEKRAQYDQFGAYWKQQQAQKDSAQRDASTAQSHAFDEFMQSIFGQRERQYSSVFDQGQDIHARIQISLEESFRGAQKTLQLHRPHIDTQGRLQQKTQSIQVKIPAGVTDKQQIRLKGQGEAGAKGQAGDLYLEINIQPHPLYQLQGKDVHFNLRLFPWEAALGTQKDVPTLGGTVKVTVPKGCKNQQQVRLKGRGLPGSVAGDQYLHFTIVLPEYLSPQAEALYRQLAADYEQHNASHRSS
ncbi:MAG: DnaJ domain-containing protein [Legionellaceae bacterium]|nr:DnaJ domain-containing protein [Legionellaceae bacterium]